MSDKASTKNVFMVNCHASIKGLFAGMVVFSCTVISIILYAVFRNKIGDETHAAAAAASFSFPHQDSSHHKVDSRAVLITTTTTTAVTLATQYYNALVPPPVAFGPFTSISKTPKKILYSIAIVEIVNLCLLIISLLATTWALVKIRKLQYRRTTTRKNANI
jgi:hypothetical protein